MGRVKHIRLIAFFIFFVCMTFSHAKEIKTKQPTVALILTGGTIVEKTDPKTGASIPVLSGDDIISSIPELKKLANLKVVEFSNIDSSQMTPEIWAKLSRVVDNLLKDEEIVGAVIAHGTDTMADAAFFLDTTLETNKSVVFTGAMKNSSDPSSDGPPNLINAVTQVLSPKAKNWGVTLTMNQYVHSPEWVVKTETTNLQSFDSGEKGYLGYIYNGVVYRYNDRQDRTRIKLPEKLPKVALVVDYPGSDGSAIRNYVDHGVEGIVVESLGAGNVNKDMYEAILYALEKNVIVAVTTIVPHGRVYPIYGDLGGGAMLQKAGAILTGLLKGDKSRILLMLALPYLGHDKEKLKELLDHP